MAAPHVRGAGGCVLLHNSYERELRRTRKCPPGRRRAFIKGMYLLQPAEGSGPRVQLLGSGTILREVIAAVGAAERVRRQRRHLELPELHRTAPRGHGGGPLEPAASGRAAADQLCRAMPGADATARPLRLPTTSRRSPTASAPTFPDATGCLGTDGFGRSDYRRKLRSFFEVDRHYVTIAALQALALDGKVDIALAGRTQSASSAWTRKSPAPSAAKGAPNQTSRRNPVCVGH